MENPYVFPFAEIDFNYSDNEGRTIYHNQQQGMTLLDWYAGQAMQGILANTDLTEKFDSGTLVARKAFMCAKNVLKERGELKEIQNIND